MKNKILYYLLLILFSASSIAANEQGKYLLILNDGRTIEVISFAFEKEGKILVQDINELERNINTTEILEINKLSIDEKFQECVVQFDGAVTCGRLLKYLPGDYISIIISGKDTLFYQVNSIKNIHSKEIPQSSSIGQNNFEFGMNIGFPSGLNIIGGYWYGPFGLHISGSYIFIADGFQLNISYKLFDKNEARHSFSLVAGNSNIRKDKYGSGGNLKNFHWEYYGATYNIYFYGFWVEFGFSGGNGNYNNPQVIFQLGYIYRLK